MSISEERENSGDTSLPYTAQTALFHSSERMCYLSPTPVYPPFLEHSQAQDSDSKQVRRARLAAAEENLSSDHTNLLTMHELL